MDYGGGNPNPMAANDPMAGEGGEAGGMEEIHIASDALPAGLEEGDKLVCVGRDESGHTFKLEKAAGGEGKGMSWEDEARSAMSPRNPQKEAM